MLLLAQEAAWKLGEQDMPVNQQPLVVMIANALFEAVQRPAAILLPFLGWAMSFRAVAMLFDVTLSLSTLKSQIPSPYCCPSWAIS